MPIKDEIVHFGQSLLDTGKRMAINYANNLIQQGKDYVKNAANSAIDQALDKVPGPLRGVAKTAINSGINAGINAAGLGGLLGGISAGASYSGSEDFNKLRMINKKMVQIDFMQEWNYRLEIEGAPDDLDFFIKDISFTAFDIKTDEEACGSQTYTFPTGDQPTRVSFTARDSNDGLVTSFLCKWWGQCSLDNATVGLPLAEDGYVKEINIYNITTKGEEVLYFNRYVFPTQMGEVTRSRENAQFMEIPVTLVQFGTML